MHQRIAQCWDLAGFASSFLSISYRVGIRRLAWVNFLRYRPDRQQHGGKATYGLAAGSVSGIPRA